MRVLLGKQTAIVPIGISCQAAFQIKLQKDLLQSLAGEDLALLATPFDWRIVGLGSIAGMIERWELSPSSADEITLINIAGAMDADEDVAADGETRHSAFRPYWRREQCWFWHEKFLDFDSFTAKQTHLAKSLASIDQVKRRIFFASNVQTNLVNMQKRAGGFDIEIDIKDALRLASALEKRFGPSELHVITRPALTAGFGDLRRGKPKAQFVTRVGDAPVFIYAFPKNKSTWHGDSGLWGQAFQNAFTSAKEELS